MPTHGGEKAGFSVEYDPGRHAIQLEGWGFWPNEVAAELDRAVVATCRLAVGSFDVVVDATRLVPQREDGQAALARMFLSLRAFTVRHVAIVAPSMLTRMQFIRLAKEAQVRSAHYLASVEEVEACLK